MAQAETLGAEQLISVGVDCCEKFKAHWLVVQLNKSHFQSARFLKHELTACRIYLHGDFPAKTLI